MQRRLCQFAAAITVGIIACLPTCVGATDSGSAKRSVDLTVVVVEATGDGLRALGFTQPSKAPGKPPLGAIRKKLKMAPGESGIVAAGDLPSNARMLPNWQPPEKGLVKKALLAAAEKRKEVFFASHETLTVTDGGSGTAFVRRPVQYMERREDGLFALKSIDVGWTVTAQATITPAGWVRVQLERSAKVVSGRFPIEGVDLDVGHLIVDTRETQTSLILKDGQTITGGLAEVGDMGRSRKRRTTLLLLTAKIRE